MKGIQIGKKVVKISLFTDDMVLYLKDPKISTQKLDNINSFSNLPRHKITYKNQQPSYTATMNKFRKNIGKKFHL
jgi:predicted metal-dependent RNase